jgi:hypothetical protein
VGKGLQQHQKPEEKKREKLVSKGKKREKKLMWQ